MPNISAASEHDTRSIKKRRPMLSGQFVAVPMELLAFGRQLKLAAGDVTLVTAIASFPPGWDLTHADVAARALCSEATAQRRLAGMVKRGLITREDAWFKGRVAGFRYDLNPLWEALRGVARSEAGAQPEDQNDVQSDPTERQNDVQTERQNDVPPLKGQPSESQRLAKTKSCSNSSPERAVAAG